MQIIAHRINVRIPLKIHVNALGQFPAHNTKKKKKSYHYIIGLYQDEKSLSKANFQHNVTDAPAWRSLGHFRYRILPWRSSPAMPVQENPGTLEDWGDKIHPWSEGAGQETKTKVYAKASKMWKFWCGELEATEGKPRSWDGTQGFPGAPSTFYMLYLFFLLHKPIAAMQSLL